jgi:hypothetical protein
MLISRITLEISGSFTSWLEIFMISVDFCIAPVTLNMAVLRGQLLHRGHACRGHLEAPASLAGLQSPDRSSDVAGAMP